MQAAQPPAISDYVHSMAYDEAERVTLRRLGYNVEAFARAALQVRPGEAPVDVIEFSRYGYAFG